MNLKILLLRIYDELIFKDLDSTNIGYFSHMILIGMKKFCFR